MARSEPKHAECLAEGEPCASCGAPMFVTMAVDDVEMRTEHHVCQRTPEILLTWLLTRIGGWTNARWDQHLRQEFGDEATNVLIERLKKGGVVPPRW